jgi:ferric-dicitrate binding protein FerR (iron transport regulator)
MFAVRCLFVPVFGAALAVSCASAVADGCSRPERAPDGNTVVRCRQVTIEIERDANVSLGGRRPGSIDVRSGAVYIEDGLGGGPTSFQVRTPDAIASVRGTRWAVDVSTVRSSVFVEQGAVRVTRRLDKQSVTLRAGDGVDVEAETNPLTVKRWPSARVRGLLGRFGR